MVETLAAVGIGVASVVIGAGVIFMVRAALFAPDQFLRFANPVIRGLTGLTMLGIAHDVGFHHAGHVLSEQAYFPLVGSLRTFMPWWWFITVAMIAIVWAVAHAISASRD